MRSSLPFRLSVAVIRPFVWTALATALAAAPAYAQSTWFVDAAAPGPGDGTAADPYAEIQTAIDAATTVDGDTLLVQGGTYTEALTVQGKVLTIRAAPGGIGATVSRVDQSGIPCLTVRGVAAPGLSLEGLRFGQDASISSNGRGVDIEDSFVQLINCEMEDLGSTGFGVADDGGGLRCGVGSSVELLGCRIERCEARQNGGAIAFSGDALKLTSSVFRQNRLSATFGPRGGAIYTSGTGTFEVDGCLFEFNVASRGGAIYVNGSGASIRSTTFSENGNFATNEAGGVRGSGIIRDCEFIRNLGQEGAAVTGTWAITGSTFVANGGSDSGAESTAYQGTGAGSTMTDCVIRDHFGASQGSAPPSAVTGATLRGCLFENNGISMSLSYGASGGGAITNCNAFDCVFRGNRASGFVSGSFSGQAQGGAAQSCTVVNCLFEDNEASLGGAVADCTATGCQFRGNDAVGDIYSSVVGFGGAAYDSVLQNCTLVGNRAFASSGGVDGGSVADCIVVGNFPDQVSSTSQVSYSCVEGGAPGIGNIDENPRLWGPAAGDFNLLFDSPCIDAGDPTLADPDGSRRDMGAIPFNASYVGSPRSFCEPGPDSFGCTPSLEALSPATVTSPFTFESVRLGSTSTALPFFATTTQLLPYQNGNLCLGGAFRRGSLGTQTTASSPCGSTFRFTVAPNDFFAFGFTPGDQLYVQVLYRDAGSTSGVGITAALETVLLP